MRSLFFVRDHKTHRKASRPRDDQVGRAPHRQRRSCRLGWVGGGWPPRTIPVPWRIAVSEMDEPEVVVCLRIGRVELDGSAVVIHRTLGTAQFSIRGGQVKVRLRGRRRVSIDGAFQHLNTPSGVGSSNQPYPHVQFCIFFRQVEVQVTTVAPDCLSPRSAPTGPQARTSGCNGRS